MKISRRPKATKHGNTMPATRRPNQQKNQAEIRSTLTHPWKRKTNLYHKRNEKTSTHKQENTSLQSKKTLRCTHEKSSMHHKRNEKTSTHKQDKTSLHNKKALLCTHEKSSVHHKRNEKTSLHIKKHFFAQNEKTSVQHDPSTGNHFFGGGVTRKERAEDLSRL
jgi:hypothetical protein